MNSSARRFAVSGVRWEGLSTNVLPAAIASGANQSGIIAGKLNGVIPQHTPSGKRCIETSTPRATWSSVSPFISVVMPAASSTTSIPRLTSPRASSRCLPFSRVTSSASWSSAPSSSAWRPNMRRARLVTGSSCHASNASAADPHGVVDLGRPRQGHAAEHLAGRGIRHVEPLVRLGGDRPPADEVLDLAHGLL